MAEAPTRTLPTTVGITGAPGTTLVNAGAAGAWYIVRNMHITNETAAQITVTMGIGTTATDAATGRHFFAALPIAANSTLDWSGALVLLGHATTPDLLYAFSNTASACTISVSGVTGP